MDGAAFLTEAMPATYVLIYTDTWPGEFSHLDATLASLRPGALHVIDDLLPQPTWPEVQAAKVPALIESIEARKGLATVRLAWSSGLMIRHTSCILRSQRGGMLPESWWTSQPGPPMSDQPEADHVPLLTRRPAITGLRGHGGRHWKDLVKTSPTCGPGTVKGCLNGWVRSRPIAAETPMTPVLLDPTRLLGFRLEARETVSIDGNGARTAIYRGAKTGVKLGGKPAPSPMTRSAPNSV